MSESKLRDQSLEFAVSVINLVKDLKSKHETIISKLQIALKEANETGYWLELLYKTDYIDEQTFKSLDAACASIRVMLISSINTSKESSRG